MNSPINNSLKKDNTWKDGDLKFYELIVQEYSNCKISSGIVKGHPIDTVYLRMEKNGIVTTELLLRPDELAAIAWCSTGCLWSILLE